MTDKSQQPTPVVPKTQEPPHNIDLEMAVLGVILDGRHTASMATVRTVIPHPLMFFKRLHRFVYVACLELDDVNERIDSIMVCEHLSKYPHAVMMERLTQYQRLLDANEIDTITRERFRILFRRGPQEYTSDFTASALASCGGHNAVSDLAGALASLTGLNRNAELVRDYYLKRRGIHLLGQISTQLYQTTHPFRIAAEQAMEAILKLTSQDQVGVIRGIEDVVGETLAQLADRSSVDAASIQTGLAEVDRLLRTLRPGGLYVLAARPGVGKTSLALKMIASAIANSTTPVPSLFFSLEVDRNDLAKKLISAQAKVSFARLEAGTLSPHEQERINTAIKSFGGWPLDILDVSDLTVQGLRSAARRRVNELKGGLRFIVIDYLQLITTEDQDKSEYEKISEITRALKVLARDLRIPILALSQMSRDIDRGAKKDRREPRLSDLRGSGSIEQDADVVIFQHRVDGDEVQKADDSRTIKVIVAKNRFGPTGYQMLRFVPDILEFTQIADEAYGEEPLTMSRQELSAAERRSRSERANSPPSAGEDVFGPI